MNVVDVLRKQVQMNFDEAVEQVKRIILDEGLGILLTKSIDEIVRKKLGLRDYPRYTIILVCMPEFAKMALDVSKDVGNLFPCSFVVYENDSKVFISHVTIMKAAADIGLASADQMAPLIRRTSERVHAA